MYSEYTPRLFEDSELEKVDSQKWIYACNDDDSARFSLGIRGEKTLVCFGVNPSTAKPRALDNTLKSVERIAMLNGFDSWLMLNLYPQRATNPNDMHKQLDLTLHKGNIEEIKKVLVRSESVFWAAWGTLIEKRPYLKDCLRDSYNVSEKNKQEWVSFGKRSIKGHPHHPLYLKSSSKPERFNIVDYLDLLK